MNIPQAIMTKRKQSKLPQRVFGLGPNNMSRIENGQVEPTITSLIKICEVLGCKVSELINLAETL